MNTRRFRGTKSGIGRPPNAAELLEKMRPPIGQHCPIDCPSPPVASTGHLAAAGARDRLGQPLNIRQVARLLGCSPWNVRHRFIPQGLPHFRSGASSKLIFYEAQVVRWIESQQAKGG